MTDREKLIKIVKEKEAWLPQVGNLGMQGLYRKEQQRNGYKDKTNADRIRAMTDEEMAQELALVAGWDRQEYEKAKRIGIEKVMLDWLKQPTEE